MSFAAACIFILFALWGIAFILAVVFEFVRCAGTDKPPTGDSGGGTNELAGGPAF